MKNMVWGCIMCAALGRGALAQPVPASRVPASVGQSYHSRFPGGRPVEWKLKSDRNYEAEFKLNGVDVAAKFDSTGQWLETETTIGRSKLPSEVRSTIAREFGGYRIIETQTLERFGERRLRYEVHLENRVEIVKVQVEASGAVLTRSAKPKQ